MSITFSSAPRPLTFLRQELDKENPCLTFEEIAVVIKETKNAELIMKDFTDSLTRTFEILERQPHITDYAMITERFIAILAYHGLDRTGIETTASRGLLVDEVPLP